MYIFPALGIDWSCRALVWLCVLQDVKQTIVVVLGNMLLLLSKVQSQGWNIKKKKKKSYEAVCTGPICFPQIENIA